MEFPISLLLYKIKRKLGGWNDSDYQKVHSIILKKLFKEYGSIILKYQNNVGINRDVKYIWNMWLQGEDKAPFIVQKSMSRLSQHLPENLELVTITEENMNDYIEFPDYIMDKYKKGLITKTHFSDLVRARLLSQYGGIWVDSTVYTSKDIPFELLNQDFFTINENNRYTGSRYVSKSRWTGFLMGGGIVFYLLFWMSYSWPIGKIMIRCMIIF